MKSKVVPFVKVFIVSVCLAGIAWSAPAVKGKKVETKQLMEKFLIQLSKLKIFFVSQEKFMDAKNTQEISALLKEFARLTKLAKHDPSLMKDNFKFSGQVLEEHIVNTERVFRLGNKDFARWQLTSTVGVCMSCHTQVPSNNKYFVDFGNYKMFSSEFDQAEFLFATRAYDQAFTLYDKVIDGYPNNKLRLDDVEVSLERQLAYFSRIKRSPLEAIAKMKSHQKNSLLPKNLHENMNTWITQFENWGKQVLPDPKTATDKEIVDYAEKNLETKWTSKGMQGNNPDLVTYLRTSGILYEYLNTHPESKSVPDLLYWLAICDRSIQDNFFYSLADLYLKECIFKYPGSAIAARCFKEYELETIAGFTGSAGTFLPSDVREELTRMKTLLDSKTNPKIQ